MMCEPGLKSREGGVEFRVAGLESQVGGIRGAEEALLGRGEWSDLEEREWSIRH